MQSPFSHARFTSRYRLMVVSAKGGVGKSTTTVNLAAALTQRGYKVGLFDADVYGPNLPALLGLRRKAQMSEHPDPRTMLPIEARFDSPDMRPIQPIDRYGMKLISLALLVGENQAIQPQPEAVGQMIRFMLNRVHWGDADVVLIDMPPGTGEPLHSLLSSELVSAALVVTTREQLAHLDNSRLLTLLRRTTVPVAGVVENMTHILCPKCGESIELYPLPAAEVQHIYGDTPILASLPFHPQLIRQNTKPLPLAEPDSPVSRSLMALADEVMNRLRSFS
jgi:ATP-binding protein involved in chromosome partitioning